MLTKNIKKKIEVVYKSFLWTVAGKVSNKALVSWEKDCYPGVVDGLNIINLNLWNMSIFIKKLWTISLKKDIL